MQRTPGAVPGFYLLARTEPVNFYGIEGNRGMQYDEVWFLRSFTASRPAPEKRWQARRGLASAHRVR